jgi:hypothetical protein
LYVVRLAENEKVEIREKKEGASRLDCIRTCFSEVAPQIPYQLVPELGFNLVPRLA